MIKSKMIQNTSMNRTEGNRKSIYIAKEEIITVDTTIKVEANISNDERVTKVDMKDYLRNTTHSKIRLTLQEIDKVKEVEMTCGDAKEDDNTNYYKEVVNIDEFNKTIVEMKIEL